MNRLIATDKNNWTALIARLAIGITILPHGAQKLLAGLAAMALMAQWVF